VIDDGASVPAGARRGDYLPGNGRPGLFSSAWLVRLIVTSRVCKPQPGGYA